MSTAKDSNTVLRVGVAPWFMMHPECFSISNCFSGFELEVLEVITEMLNLTVKIVATDSIGCGSKKKNSSRWSSLGGMLQRGEIDITGNVCALEKNRMEDFGYSWPVWMDGQTFWIKAPTLRSETFNPFAPFRGKTWLILVLIFICSILAMTVVKYKRKLSDAFQTAAGQLFSSFCLFKAPPRSLFWVCGFFAVAALKVAYTTYIRAALFYPRPYYAPFQDINDLALKLSTGEFKLIHYHKDYKEVIPKGPEETQKLILQAVQKHGYYVAENSLSSTLLDGLIKNDNAVMIKGSIFADVYAMEYANRSMLWRIPDNLVRSTPVSYLWRKDFEFAEKFNKALISMSAATSEILKRTTGYTVKQVHNNPMLIASVHSNSEPISMISFTGPVLCFILSLVFSIFVFCMEFCFHNLIKSHLLQSFQRFNIYL
ncbi:hypothetical protein T4B_6661 [Trichinella pseudospiralis]|uniref:Uncharacterized protein n=2 Tax=Trichinella pseudospiralis TaxID=6337 RepID=A0A0V1FEM6_TRIPS|nr:hypothetical protein T4D_5583 [Trichinella pseudospiralis]KRZ25011.1 hypothetical protein T4B_6661 [Trichinella pseudospiralis]KRZ34442.1 hypothetical protein T4C_595 [Trichinella pseudospiralis]